MTPSSSFPRTRLALAPALFLLSGLAGARPQCDGWGVVPTLNVGDRNNMLTGVTALSANDAWAVGLWRDLSGASGTLALRWDGTAWTQTTVPDTSHLGALPETAGVEATPNGDVWVVGKVSTPYPTYLLPLVMRWSGGTWDTVDTVTLRPETVYPFADRGGSLVEAAAWSEDDIWAVGQAAGYGDGNATTVPLAVHWDGTTWTDVEVPRVSDRHHELTGLAVIAPDDVWAVGNYRNLAQAYHALAYHWDGSTWTYVPNPIEPETDSGLIDIVATATDDVWAIGTSSSAGVQLMHWDGSQWSLVTAPPNTGGALAAVGPNELWASGWDGYWKWDGTTWTEHPVSVAGATYVLRGGGMEIVGACDVWTVGFWTLSDGITSFTLSERLGAAGDLGTVYCDETQNPNNVADIAIDTIDSSASSITVSMTGAATNQFTYLLVGNGMNALDNPPGAKGSLCIVGGNCLGRYDKDVLNTGSAGAASLNILGATSNPCAGAVQIVPGATWNFQWWHRQPMGTPATFSSALSVTFQ